MTRWMAERARRRDRLGKMLQGRGRGALALSAQDKVGRWGGGPCPCGETGGRQKWVQIPLQGRFTAEKGGFSEHDIGDHPLRGQKYSPLSETIGALHPPDFMP